MKNISASNLTIESIYQAQERLYQAFTPQPLRAARQLSQKHGTDIRIKEENLNFTASFKERGAYNKLAQLTPDQLKAGVVCVSAGNHAMALAYYAQSMGCPAVVVMPQSAPHTKVNRVKSFGAEVILHGQTFADAATLLPDLIQSRNLTLVHPFDDEQIIAGQGTIGLEIVKEWPEVEVIVVPIGGGGLISGVAIAAKTLNPKIKIIGVQTELYNSMAASLTKGKKRDIQGGASVAEGIAIKEPGIVTQPLVSKWVDEIVVCSEALIEDAVAELLLSEKTLVEGAGAAGLAALYARPDLFKGKKTAIILCGGNIDQSILVSILHRSLVRQGRIVRFFVKAPDNAGLLAKSAAIIAEHGGNIRDVFHDRTFSNPGAKTTTIEFDVELQDPKSAQAIIDAFALQNIQVVQSL